VVWAWHRGDNGVTAIPGSTAAETNPHGGTLIKYLEKVESAGRYLGPSCTPHLQIPGRYLGHSCAQLRLAFFEFVSRGFCPNLLFWNFGTHYLLFFNLPTTLHSPILWISGQGALPWAYYASPGTTGVVVASFELLIFTLFCHMCVSAADFFKTMATTYESTRCREPRKRQSQFSTSCDAVAHLFRRPKNIGRFLVWGKFEYSQCSL